MNDDDLNEDPASEADTRAALLANAKRTIVPIRKAFVQVPRSLAAGSHRRGPLSDFVARKDRRGLEAFLIILAATSSGGEAGDDWTTTHPIMVWARAFGTTQNAERASAANAVSKVMHRLEERRLIERSRSGRERKIKVRLLREDGSGRPYTRPAGNEAGERFLRLDHAYWEQDWQSRLTLPGLAMLLVALSEQQGFTLPTERVPGWYGWSADTAERGFAELEEVGLLSKVKYRRKEPLSPNGYGMVNKYYLGPPFRTADTKTFAFGQPGAFLADADEQATAKAEESTGTASAKAADE